MEQAGGATGDTHFYEPALGHGLKHDPFKAIVAPRPIGWISTVDRDGRGNLAPYSFFNAVGDRPPMLAFSSIGRKDSVANAEATGEFVWNLVTRPLTEAMNETSRPLPHGEDEMRLAGLEAAPSVRVRPPRVAAATAMECKVLQILELRDLDGRATDQHLVIGQVVGVHVRREHLRDGVSTRRARGRWRVAAARAIMPKWIACSTCAVRDDRSPIRRRLDRGSRRDDPGRRRRRDARAGVAPTARSRQRRRDGGSPARSLRRGPGRQGDARSGAGGFPAEACGSKRRGRRWRPRSSATPSHAPPSAA